MVHSSWIVCSSDKLNIYSLYTDLSANMNSKWAKQQHQQKIPTKETQKTQTNKQQKQKLPSKTSKQKSIDN